MKVSFSLLAVALYAQVSVASWGLSKHIYNKWHQTELERWLDDHDIAYPAASNRKDLETLVKDNWEGYIITPYQSWEPKQQASWLTQKGIEVTDKQAQNKDWLLATLKKNWYETESKAEDSYGDVKTWVFDTWTDSELKSFLDYHNIPNPSPRKRDSMISSARANYATVAQKAGETAAYPGDWLYSSWSESDLKAWLDSHGYPAPQTSSRDKLVAAVRKNSRQASLKYDDVKSTVANKMFGSWSDSDLKAWFDKNGIPVPQNGKRDEYLALARKNAASLTGDTYSASITSAYGAASSSAGNAYHQATNSAGSVYNAATDSAGSVYTHATDSAGSIVAQATNAVKEAPHIVADTLMGTWSETRIKAYLDSRGVPVPQNGKKDELLALARLHKHKAATGYGSWTFDTWTIENLKTWLKGHGKYVENQAGETRDQLAASASSAYAAASTSGGSGYASVTSAFAAATDYAKDSTFDTWTDSDLKSYLDSYGVQTYQGTTKNELVAQARRCSKLFTDGFKQETAFERFQRQGWAGYGYVMNMLGAAPSSVSSAASSVSASGVYGAASTLSASGSSAVSVASKSAASAASVASASGASVASAASKSAASAASVASSIASKSAISASKSASSAASILSKHASSAKSEL